MLWEDLPTTSHCPGGVFPRTLLLPDQDLLSLWLSPRGHVPFPKLLVWEKSRVCVLCLGSNRRVWGPDRVHPTAAPPDAPATVRAADFCHLYANSINDSSHIQSKLRNVPKVRTHCTHEQTGKDVQKAAHGSFRGCSHLPNFRPTCSFS